MPGVIKDLSWNWDDAKIYRMVMTLPCELIELRQIYQIVRYYHRFFMKLIRVETVNEGLASHFRALEKRNSIGRDLGPKPLIEATLLRAAGIGAHGDNDDTLQEKALDYHFKAHGNDSRIHFLRRRARRRASTKLLVPLAEHGSSPTVARIRGNTSYFYSNKHAWQNCVAAVVPPRSGVRMGDEAPVSETMIQHVEEAMRRLKCGNRENE